MSKQLLKLSKQLSYYLRHEPGGIGLTMNEDGWVEVRQLLENWPNKALSFDQLEEIVFEDDKQRYQLHVARTPTGLEARVRAVQGHSTKIVGNMKYDPVENPPAQLYHGTATQFLESIKLNGLLPMSRACVHLSADYDTAIEVGARHGEPAVLVIDAQKLVSHGHKIYQAVNGVYLIEEVPSAFIDFPK